MDNKTAFTYEMMDTPRLAQECHKLRQMIDAEAHLLTLGRGSIENKKFMQYQLKKAKQILKARQMRMVGF